jgi:MFS transporter, SP family, galactose:H+ symporter
VSPPTAGGDPAASASPRAAQDFIVETAGARERMTPWLAAVLIVVLFAGGLFGYDQGVISGALNGIKKSFSLDVLMVQVVTSWVTLGALAGSLAGGEFGDRIGRKRTMLIAGALFTLGAAIQWGAANVAILVAGRLMVGIGVGVAAVAAPLYAAELAPASMRGRFVSGYQLAITVGIFLAYLVDGWLAESGAWRAMLGAAAVPGAALFVVALVAPESPRWLMMRLRRDDAARVMHKVQPAIDTAARLADIETSLQRESKRATWSDVFAPAWRRPLMVGVGLAVFQQITGINAIIYYANQIFASAGFETETARTTVTTWAIGGVNVAATLIAIAFIDNLGRRFLLLTGLFGMGASLAVVGTAFLYIAQSAETAATTGPTAAGIVTVIALVVFIICFAFSLGPVTWTVINEIFPAHVRGRGVALATAVNWGSAFVVSQCFLSLVEAIGSSATFWVFGGFCVIGWIWIYLRVPETKKRSLEQIQSSWGTLP